MADNLGFTPGSGATLRTKDQAGIHYPGYNEYAGTVEMEAGGGPEAGARRVAPATVPTSTITTLASSATSAQLLASTVGRRGLMLTNTDANGVYVKFGTTASATSFSVFIPAGAFYVMDPPIYTGRIDAIWVADGAGSLIATELT